MIVGIKKPTQDLNMTENKFDYYKAPSDEIFNEIKRGAIAVWETTKDNTYGYVDEKVGRIKDLENIADNAWFIVAMFDSGNQWKLYLEVNEEAQQALEELFAWVKTINVSD